MVIDLNSFGTSIYTNGGTYSGVFMDKQNIVIIGGGHGAIPSAAHNAALGHNVSIVNRHFHTVSEIGEAGKIELLYPIGDLEAIFRAGTLGLNRNSLKGTPVNGTVTNKVGRNDLTSLECPINSVFGFDSDNLDKVIGDADLIRVIIPSVGHRGVAELISPYLGKEKQSGSLFVLLKICLLASFPITL